MRRKFGLALIVAMWAWTIAAPIATASVGVPASATATAVTDAPAATRVAGSWIVTWKAKGKSAADARAIAKSVGGSSGKVYSHALNGFEFHGSAKAAANLLKKPSIRTVVANQTVHVAAETLPSGISRIGANSPFGLDAQELGFSGAGARVAVLDTGIDLTHPDLVANLDWPTLGTNCYSSGPPQDGHGHGTHVAGTIAAVGGNGIGVIGVAPSARLVPVKVLSDTGSGAWSNVICGIDYVTGLNTDGDPSNDVDVVNMSLGDTGTLGTCTDGGLRQAICTSVAAGITYVAAAGNSSADTSTFVPAAYPEVIAVSAITDFDGKPGGLGGCQFIITLLANFCDDQFASFSNRGAAVDLAAPGVNVYSTWTGGTYQQESGTSMASPHVAGVAALVKAINHSLAPSAVRDLLISTGDRPDGSSMESGCGAGSQWIGDPDGIGEPVVNALRAVQRASGVAADLPAVSLSPADGSKVSGTVPLSATASAGSGIASVQFLADGTSLGVDTTSPYTASWDSTTTFDGAHTLTAKATSTAGDARCATSNIMSGLAIQGDWVGQYGTQGYVLGTWNTTAGTDLVALPAGVTFSLEQGSRTGPNWTQPTTDVRALEAPDQSERRAGAWYHGSEVRVRLTFASGYTGTLHLYALDWTSTTRRENIIVTDASGSRTAALASSFNQGAWLHFPVTVAAGGSIVVKVDNTASGSGNLSVLSGLFLGGPGAPLPPPPPPPPPYTIDQPGVQGDWVGQYGTQGYVLGTWNTTAGTDLVALPAGVTFSLEQGSRTGPNWTQPTTDVRALEAPDQSERRAGAWYHGSEVRVRLTFASGYTGTLHLYALDWTSTTRRENIIVTDASGSRTAALASSFNQGAWLHFPVTVAAGGSIVVKVDNTASGSGNLSVLSGLFLGGPGAPLPPPPPPPPPYTIDQPGVQGDWVGQYGTQGYVLGTWNTTAGTDLVALPAGVTFSLEQGSRTGPNWTQPTTDVRALEAPDQSERRAGAWYHGSEVRVRLTFASGYTGTLHLYALDWTSTTRRENIIVTDASGSRTAALASSFNQGAWLHFPVTVAAGGSIVVKVDNTAGSGLSVLSGLFLGGPGAPWH